MDLYSRLDLQMGREEYGNARAPVTRPNGF